MKNLFLTVAMLVASFAFGSPAAAWEDVKGMNKQIDDTNFIVNSGCSGTLISVEYRLILTAHHCVSRFIKRVTRDEIGDDGKVEKVTFERRDRVTIAQNDYAKYETVGAISYQTDILDYEQSVDLALLQLVGDNLRSTISAPILPMGADVSRGDPVVAVGNPLGLDATITSGIISSVNRTFRVPWALNEMVPILQIDADINPGNSGGVVYDDSGRIIGVVVAGFRGSNLGFAIPIFELYEMLEKNCMASLYDHSVDDEACRIERDSDDDDAEEADE